eukprot:SAG11_NODE_6986_length_1214_cov_0.965919_1_plen_65_part_00
MITEIREELLGSKKGATKLLAEYHAERYGALNAAATAQNGGGRNGSKLTFTNLESKREADRIDF